VRLWRGILPGVYQYHNSFYWRVAIENSKGPIPRKLVPSPIPYSTISPPLVFYEKIIIIDIIITLGLYY